MAQSVATFTRARELCERLGEPPEYLQVMFWLATASVVRGELPQALEVVTGMPRAAEARGNRGTLLNVIRAALIDFSGDRIARAGGSPICCAPSLRRLRGWAYRIRTSESVRELSDLKCVTTSPEVGSSPAAETIRVRAA